MAMVTKPPVPGTFAQRLAAELDRQLTINARLGEGLLRELDRVQRDGRPVLDADDVVVETVYTPDRDWARCYGHYRNVNKDLLAEERERAKLRLLAQQQGHTVLSDEEFDTELRQLGMEAVKTLSDNEIIAALKERGIAVVIPAESEGDE